jgi:hypothetical protein
MAMQQLVQNGPRLANASAAIGYDAFPQYVICPE